MPWVETVLGMSCPEYELSWVWIVMGTSWPGHKVTQVRVDLGTSCPGYESSWVRIVLSTSCPDPLSHSPSYSHSCIHLITTCLRLPSCDTHHQNCISLLGKYVGWFITWQNFPFDKYTHFFVCLFFSFQTLIFCKHVHFRGCLLPGVLRPDDIKTLWPNIPKVTLHMYNARVFIRYRREKVGPDHKSPGPKVSQTSKSPHLNLLQFGNKSYNIGLTLV